MTHNGDTIRGEGDKPRMVTWFKGQEPFPDPPWTCSCGRQYPSLHDLMMHAHEFGGLLHGDGKDTP